MSAKMIADFRRKPSRARQEAARKEREAHVERELDKIMGLMRFGIDYGMSNAEPLTTLTPLAFESLEQPKPKEPLPMLEKPEREVTTFRGGKWTKPEKERRSRGRG